MVTVIKTSTGFCCKMCGRYYVDYYKKNTFSFEIVSLFCQLNEGANCINNQNIWLPVSIILFSFLRALPNNLFYLSKQSYEKSLDRI